MVPEHAHVSDLARFDVLEAELRDQFEAVVLDVDVTFFAAVLLVHVVVVGFLAAVDDAVVDRVVVVRCCDPRRQQCGGRCQRRHLPDALEHAFSILGASGGVPAARTTHGGPPGDGRREPH